MDQARAIWIRDPLAILADGAERGIVVQGGRIVELNRSGAPSGARSRTRGTFTATPPIPVWTSRSGR